MSQRVIRISELASFPAQEARPAQPAKAGNESGRGKKGKNVKKAKRGKPARPAKKGKLPVSPATVWRWVREGKFPKPFKLGDGITVWNEDEVDAFMAKRAAGDAQ